MAELRHDPDAPVFVISVAAELAGLHPQTLRAYDRLGLVQPGRSAGRGRRYSSRNIDALREVVRLSQQDGVNLAGIKRILALQAELLAARDEIRRLAQRLVESDAEAGRREAAAHAAHRRELVPVRRRAVVRWDPPR